MAKRTVSAFIAGEIIGAALVYFTCTKKGRKVVKEGLAWVDEKINEAEAEDDEEFEDESEEESEEESKD